MKTYLVLTAPDGRDFNHEKTRFVRDGFSWLGLLFGPFWLLFHRAWLSGFSTLALTIATSGVGAYEGLSFAASAASLALNIFIALEGREWNARAMEKRGWQLRDIIVAGDLDEAEEMFFTALAEKDNTPLKHFDVDATKDTNSTPHGFGLMGRYETN